MLKQLELFLPIPEPWDMYDCHQYYFTEICIPLRNKIHVFDASISFFCSLITDHMAFNEERRQRENEWFQSYHNFDEVTMHSGLRFELKQEFWYKVKYKCRLT